MAFWLLEGAEKLGAGTGGEGEKQKEGGVSTLLLLVNLFSSIQIIR